MSNPYESPANSPQQSGVPHGEGDATGGVIPYKNPHALMAYYGGILTLFCCFTPLPLGFIPMVLGIIGLRKRAANPIIKGSAHAWIGIVLGGLSGLISLLSLLMTIVYVAGVIGSRR